MKPVHFIILLTALVLAYFSFTAADNFLRAYQLERQQESLEQEIASLQETSRQLEALRDYLTSDEYIELAARQQLGWVRPGEVAVVVVTPEGTGTAANRQPSPSAPQPWWKAFFPPEAAPVPQR